MLPAASLLLLALASTPAATPQVARLPPAPALRPATMRVERVDQDRRWHDCDGPRGHHGDTTGPVTIIIVNAPVSGGIRIGSPDVVTRALPRLGAEPARSSRQISPAPARK